jgi:hypothetical protein
MVLYRSVDQPEVLDEHLYMPLPVMVPNQFLRQFDDLL